MQIGRTARHAGVAIYAWRYYERHGILPEPRRQASGYRRYGEDDVARLRFVRRAQGLGFTLTEIRDLLALSSRPADDMDGLKAAATEQPVDGGHNVAELTRIRAGL